MKNEKVDKNICLEIFKRSLRHTHQIEDFRGPAEKWRKYNEPDFQSFAQEHGITPKTNIAIYDNGLDNFGVNILH